VIINLKENMIDTHARWKLNAFKCCSLCVIDDGAWMTVTMIVMQSEMIHHFDIIRYKPFLNYAQHQHNLLPT